MALAWHLAPSPGATAAKPASGSPTADTDWLNYANDLAGSRYAPIDQINAANFNDLEVAWRFRTESLGLNKEYNLEGTPLAARGVLYATAGARRDVVALDARSGELLWLYRYDEGARAAKAPRKLSGHGVAYWTDGVAERILYVTTGYRLISLDATTGRVDAAFGNQGVIDLKQDFDQDPLDLENADVGLHSTPCVVNGVVIVGAAHLPGAAPRTHRNVKGYTRGFDARTGKRLWTFHTVPKKGEFGYDTWTAGTENIGNTGVWCQMSADPELNMVYIGVELPTGDFVGVYRDGAALFGESIVALDVTTGERKWHYQTVHHGLWDNDIPCAAILCDMTVDGRPVKALAQPTKQSMLYVLDRETGKPIWPIVERPVPAGSIKGEYYSPTQPIPSRPPAYDVQGVTKDSLIDFTPELRAEAIELIGNYKTGGSPFVPPSEFEPEGTWGTLGAPGYTGGTNWPGGCYDPETKLLYVYSKSAPSLYVTQVNHDVEKSDFDYIAVIAPPQRQGGKLITRNGFAPGVISVQGLPLLKPPYGRISAIDMKSGNIEWQIPHGGTPDEVRNHPSLKGLRIGRTGQAGIVGPTVTKSLLICGEPGFTTLPSGARGAMLRAYEKSSGREVGAVEMPAPQTGSIMTYLSGGRQYLVLAIGGGDYSSEYIAFGLPS